MGRKLGILYIVLALATIGAFIPPLLSWIFNLRGFKSESFVILGSTEYITIVSIVVSSYFGSNILDKKIALSRNIDPNDLNNVVNQINVINKDKKTNQLNKQENTENRIVNQQNKENNQQNRQDNREDSITNQADKENNQQDKINNQQDKINNQQDKENNNEDSLMADTKAALDKADQSDK